ncbi:MAG: HEAT repeat domain-containing protein [Limisphaerales bacterium]
MAEEPVVENLSEGRKKLASAILILFVLGLMAASIASRISSEGVGRHGRATEHYLRLIHEKKPNATEAAEAISRLDTNAMPTITNFVCFQDSWWRINAQKLLGESFLKVRIYNKFDFRTMAREGFHLVGTNAGPYLVELLRDAPLEYAGPDNRAYLASTCLVQLGPPAIPALAAGLTSDDASIRALSALAISSSSDVRHFSQVSNLVNCAHDTNTNVRAAAVFALGRVLEEPQLSVPALAQGLSDTNSAVRFHSIFSLWAFGVHSKSAIPQIEQAIAKEPTIPDAGFEQSELGPKSRAMIMEALTNALQTIRTHDETPN